MGPPAPANFKTPQKNLKKIHEVHQSMLKCKLKILIEIYIMATKDHLRILDFLSMSGFCNLYQTNLNLNKSFNGIAEGNCK